MKNNKIIAIAILLLSIILAYWFYGIDYSTIAEPQNLSETITDYIFKDDVQAQVVEMKKIGNHMLVTFTDERYENLLGFAVFKRGLNLRWLPLNVKYRDSISVEAFEFSIASKDYIAICSVNCNPDVTSYEYVTTDSNPKILYSSSITKANFIDVYENKMGYWPMLRLLDFNGNNVTLELLKARNNTVPNGGAGTAEVFMIDVVFFLIILIGFLIARYYWTYNQQSKSK